MLYLDSGGLVAVARRDGDAARGLWLAPGDRVIITPA
ncbi:SAM hydroxide adenosyltransferase [Parafrankia discariae]|nr:SAM hydroxide adenosyltransferase [Parafrankia discariae]